MIIYKCDPEKNQDCQKNSCHVIKDLFYSECECTTKREFAATDENGEPIIVVDDDTAEFEPSDE